jgi:hypothetical protein
LSRFVLNLKKTVLEGLVLIHPSSKISQTDSLGGIAGWFSHHTAFCLQPMDEIVSMDLERIGPNRETGNAVLCFEKGLCKLTSPLPDPFSHQPLGVGVEDGQILDRAFVAIREGNLVFAATDISENSVDKRNDINRLSSFGLFHGLVDSCRLRNTVKEKDLIKRQAKEVQNGKGNLFERDIGSLPKGPIEADLPP